MAVEEAQVVECAAVVGINGERPFEHFFGALYVVLVETDEGEVECDPRVGRIDGKGL